MRDNKTEVSPWLVWSLGAGFFLVEYFVRVSPSVIVGPLMRDFNVQAVQVGSLSAFFYWAYISMQIPVGVLVDRYGPSRLLVITTALCALGCFLFANATSIGLVYFARFLLGFSAAFAFVSTLKLVNNWFPVARFALLAGLTQTLGMLGAAIGDAPIAIVFNAFGWRHTMIGIAVLFIALCVAIFIYVTDRPRRRRRKKQIEQSVKKEPIEVLPALKTVLSTKDIWLNCIYIGLLYAPTVAIAEQWGVTFLKAADQVETEVAAFVVGMVFIGLAIGCPIFGWLSNRLGSRLKVMRYSAIICCILMNVIIYADVIPFVGHLSYLTLSILFFCYGLANSGLIPSYAYSSEVSPKRLTGIALGVTNMASVVLGSLFIFGIGHVLDAFWQGEMQNGVPFYDITDFHLAFVLMPICFLVSFGVTFVMKETHCQAI